MRLALLILTTLLMILGCGKKTGSKGVGAPPSTSTNTASETNTSTATAPETTSTDLPKPAELEEFSGEVKLGAKTRVLGRDGQSILAYNGNSGTIELQGGTVPEVGAVVVAGASATTPHGLLRKIVGIETVDGKTLLRTEPAKLAEAIEEGHATIALKLDPNKLNFTPAQAGVSIEKAKLAEGETEGLVVGVSDLLLTDADGDDSTSYDRLYMSASIGLDLGVDFKFDISGFSIEELSLSLNGQQSGTISVRGGGTTAFAKQITIGVLQYPPIIVPIGGFPLVIVPSVQLYLGANGQAHAKFVTSATESANFRVGFGYANSEFGPISEGDTAATVQSPSITGASASVKAYAGARGDIALYDLVSAFAGIEAYARIDVNPLAEFCQSGAAGVGGTAGISFDPFGLEVASWDEDFSIVAKDLATGDCNVKNGGGDDSRLGWLFFPEDSEDSQTLLAPRIVATPDGGLVFARSRNVGVYAQKIDALGSIDWRRHDPAATAESWKAMTLTKDGGYAIAGSTAYGPTLTRLDAGGRVLWSKQLKHSGTQVVEAVVEDQDGEFYLGGSIYTDTDVDQDLLLLKLDEEGELLWYRRIRGNAGYNNIAAMVLGQDEHLYLAGTYGIDYDDSDPEDRTSTLAWAAKFTRDGATVWSTAYTSKHAVAIHEGQAGELVLAGYGEGTTPSLHNEAWALGLDAEGGVRWARGFAFNTTSRAIAATKDGGALLGGMLDFANGARDQARGFLARIGADGSLSWARRYHAEAEETSIDFVHERPDGRIIAAGHRVPDSEQSEAWWLSLPADGLGLGDVEGATIAAATGGARDLVLLKRAAPLVAEDLTPTVEDLGRGLEIVAPPSPIVLALPE